MKKKFKVSFVSFVCRIGKIVYFTHVVTNASALIVANDSRKKHAIRFVHYAETGSKILLESLNELYNLNITFLLYILYFGFLFSYNNYSKF